ncbi:efflux RND transporter periplasmic adaptor subunit [Amphritea balenae]|nr:efflux RND transporter periplasmic adaptor subunit [Amphritea balenae]
MGFASAYAVAKQPNHFQELDCIISPSVVTDLGSSLPGVIRAITIDRSDLVQPGDVIAELDSGIEQAALELANTRAELDSEIDLQLTSAEYGERSSERYQKLYQRRAISGEDLDQSLTEAKLADIRLQLAQDKQRLASLERERADQVLQRRTIRSPIAGVVVERYKDVGEYVDNQPVARIAQLSPLHVDVIVPIARIKELQPGMSAKVWSDQVDGNWVAQVDRIDRVADPASGTIGVRLLLDNPDYSIPAGIRCRMKFQSDEAVSVDNEPQQSQVQLDAVTIEDEAKVEAKASASIPALVAEPVSDIRKPQELQAAAPTTAEQCAVLGPYTDQQRANSKAAELGSAQLTVRLEQRQRSVISGYKVLSPRLPSMAKAKAYKKRLKAAGIKDYFMFNSDQGGFGLSLGLFDQRAVAVRYKQQLKHKGVIATVAPRYRESPGYWLLLQGANSQLKGVAELADKTSVELELVACT